MFLALSDMQDLSQWYHGVDCPPSPGQLRQWHGSRGELWGMGWIETRDSCQDPVVTCNLFREGRDRGREVDEKVRRREPECCRACVVPAVPAITSGPLHS